MARVLRFVALAVLVLCGSAAGQALGLSDQGSHPSPVDGGAIAYEQGGSRTWPPLTLGANWLVANSAYTLFPSTLGEGKIFRTFAGIASFENQRDRPLPALLRGEGRDQHGAAPGRSRVRGGRLLSAVANCDNPPLKGGGGESLEGEQASRSQAAPGWLVAEAPVAKTAPAAATNPNQTLFRLDWVLHGLTSPFQLGLSRQAYKAEGIDLRIEDGKGPAATLAEVASKGAAFGLVDGATLVRAVANGAPVKAVMSIMATSPMGVVVRADANIKTLADLVGKRIAATTGEPGIAMLLAALKAQGIDSSKVEIVGMDGIQKLVSVAEGRSHAMIGGAENHAVVLGLRGVPATTLTFADAGLPMIGLVVITHNDTIRDKPAFVRGFVRATQQAYAAAERDPGASILALPKLSPGAEREFPLQRLKAALPLLRANGSSEPFGTMTDAAWAATIKTMGTFEPLKKLPAPAALFTNQFVVP
jgi:NitT/TauT family transport system substrate-binding protein